MVSAGVLSAEHVLKLLLKNKITSHALCSMSYNKTPNATSKKVGFGANLLIVPARKKLDNVHMDKYAFVSDLCLHRAVLIKYGSPIILLYKIGERALRIAH